MFNRRFPKAGRVCVRAILSGLVALPLLVSSVSADPGEPPTFIDKGWHIAADGTPFVIQHSTAEGDEQVRYVHGDLVLTADELASYWAQNPAPVIDEALVQEAIAAPAGAELELIIWLRNRPGTPVARAVRARYQPAIDAKGKPIRDFHANLRADEPMSPTDEGALKAALRGGRFPLTDSEKEELRKQAVEIEADAQTMRREIRREVERAVQKDQEAIRALIESLGGRVGHRFLTQNAVQAVLPADQLQILGKEPTLARVIELPVSSLELDQQAFTLGHVAFHNDGVDGGIWDAGVLDTGVQQNHPAFANVRFLSLLGTEDANGHGTQVAGIIASGDATFTGMAPDLDHLLVGDCAGSLVQADADWMVSTALDDPEAINLSCGLGASDTDYTPIEQFYDGLVDDNRVLLVKSAGNRGLPPDLQNPTPTITRPAGAFNILSVGNVDDQNTSDRGDDVIRRSSSRGPTNGMRRKPDLSAPGHNTRTTLATWNNTADFGDIGGTSAAAPHVTGGAVLLTDLRGNDNPVATKAVLINTADTWSDNGTMDDTSDDGPVDGSQWNGTYGWGYLDLWEAWFNGPDIFTDTVDDGFFPSGLDFRLYRGRMFANEKATLVWNRHVGYDGSNAPSAVEPLTNLNLFAYRQSSGAEIAASESVVDNVEQIAVSGIEDLILKVDVFGIVDPDVGVESYALATEEGFERVYLPTFSLTGSPTNFFGPTLRTFRVTVRNTGDITAFSNRVTLDLPPGFTRVSGAHPQNIGTLAPGASATATWTVRWDTCTPFGDTDTIRMTNTSQSYGETFSSTSGVPVVCENLEPPDLSGAP
ncbi:MAG: S8 family serine peptidase [Acidobacteriota bacterium]